MRSFGASKALLRTSVMQSLLEWDYQAVGSYLMLNWRRKLTGLLLEFMNDYQKTLLPVVQKPDGKKNWMLSECGKFYMASQGKHRPQPVIEYDIYSGSNDKDELWYFLASISSWKEATF
ncbi:uncharacterized protein LOC103976614 isoform X2 [Musa acuminata AAA Group]|uniref:uncharacterized protein LOC135606328 isoform X2 n=1 Tax=Musa acuminata AAA Group TaxID=214697 RepID=UPI0031DFEC3E